MDSSNSSIWIKELNLAIHPDMISVIKKLKDLDRKYKDFFAMENILNILDFFIEYNKGKDTISTGLWLEKSEIRNALLLAHGRSTTKRTKVGKLGGRKSRIDEIIDLIKYSSIKSRTLKEIENEDLDFYWDLKLKFARSTIYSALSKIRKNEK